MTLVEDVTAWALGCGGGGGSAARKRRGGLSQVPHTHGETELRFTAGRQPGSGGGFCSESFGLDKGYFALFAGWNRSCHACVRAFI